MDLRKFGVNFLKNVLFLPRSFFNYIILNLNLFVFLKLIWKFVIQLIERCWTTDPSLRPIPKDVLKNLEKIDPNSGGSIEKLVAMVSDIRFHPLKVKQLIEVK